MVELGEFSWLVELATLLLMAKGLELVVVRFGLARVVAYLLAGLIIAALKPHILYEPSNVVRAFAFLGIILLLFEAGLESSLREFIRGLKGSSAVAVGGVLGSLLAGLVAIPLLKFGLTQALALGIILSATSVSVTVKTFEELRALSSIEAQTIIGAAVVDDVIGLALLSLLYSLGANMDLIKIVLIAVVAFALWFATAKVTELYSRRLFKPLMKAPLEAGVETVVLAIILALAYVATRIGLSVILLAYAFGLGLTSFKYLARKVGERLRILSLLFSPLFFLYAGSRLNFTEILTAEVGKVLYLAIIVLSLAFLSKILGCFIAARALGFSTNKSLIIGIGMVPRAEVMIVAATAALENNLIGHDLYLAVLLIVPISTFVVPIIIKRMYGSLKYL